MFLLCLQCIPPWFFFFILSSALFSSYLSLHTQTYLLVETYTHIHTHTHKYKLLQDRECILFCFLPHFWEFKHLKHLMNDMTLTWKQLQSNRYLGGKKRKIDVCFNAVYYMDFSGHAGWGRNSLGLYEWIWCMFGLGCGNLFVKRILSWLK